MRFLLGLILALYVGAAHAAYWQGQTYQVPTFPQIFYNIVTDGGAACTGPTILNTTVNITGGTNTLNVPAGPFQIGRDEGKYVVLVGAGGGGGTYTGYINTVSSSTNVTLLTNVSTTVAGVTDLTFGFDDAPNFKTFNTWAKANQGTTYQVVLTIPSGKTCWMGTAQSIAGNLANSVFAGINNLIVEGTGAGLSGRNGQGLVLGSQGVLYFEGITDPLGTSARLQTVSSGSSTVTLTSASYSAGYATRFTAGDTVMVSGIEIQAGWNSDYGAPPNWQFFDYRKVISVCVNTTGCVGTAIITLDRPLSNNYRSDWPLYNDGSYTGQDMGGPASIFKINPQWDMTVEYRGLTLDGGGQSYAKARNVIFRNVTWNDAYGTVPTQNETFSMHNCVLNINAAPGWEVDKDVGTLTMNNVTGNGGANGDAVARIDFQSSSVNQWVVTNSKFGSVFGTPKASTITDSHFDLFRPGAWTNGISTPGPLNCTRCDVTDFQYGGGISMDYGRAQLLSMSGGIISYARSAVTSSGVSVPWSTNGNYYWRGGGFNTVGLFNSTTFTQNGANADIQTNEIGGFPALAGFSTSVAIWAHPAPVFTCDACTGGPNSTAINIQNGATPGKPLGEYYKRTYTPTAIGQAGVIDQVKGKLVSYTVDVTTAAVQVGNLFMSAGAQAIKQSTWVQEDLNVTINLKQFGKRVITPTTVTCDTGGGPVAGGCSGDTITQPTEAIWIAGGFNPYLNNSVTGSLPTFTITVQLNQGVVVP